MKNNRIVATAAVTALAASFALAAPAHAYKVVSVDNGGTITGKVTFKGKDPNPRSYKISKDNAVCGNEDRKLDYVRVENGALQDVIVYLQKVKSGKDWGATPKDIKIDQAACEFTPYLSIMQNGGKMAALNSDPVLHNIHTYELMAGNLKGPKKTVSNVSQPDKGSLVTKTIKLKRGPAMKVECDAHDFMHGFVFVANNPYYAQVNADGTYSIDNVPAGNYKIKAWHGFLKNQKGKAKVAAGGTTTVDFTFK